MRRILFVSCLLFSCAYAQNWSAVTYLEARGELVKALERAEQYHQSATTGPQIVKSLVHVLRLTKSAYLRTGDSLVIARLHLEIKEAEAPVKNLLQSLLADMYWEYYSEHTQVLLKNRALGTDPIFPRKWNALQLFEAIQTLYERALSPKVLLQQTPMKAYESIMVTGKDAGRYHPKLYDFLMFRTLGFYANSAIEVTRPTSYFTLDARAAFVRVDSFVNIPFVTQDTFSKTYRALTLYQEWLAFRLAEDDIYALVDADIHRLQFVRERGSGELKRTRYLHALGKWADSLKSHPVLADVRYEQALLYAGRATSYRPLEGDTYKWDFKTAHTICTNTLREYPKSRGAKSCRSLLQLIQAKNLAIQMEETNLPDRPFRIHVTYRNVPNLYLRLIRHSPLLESRLAAAAVPAVQASMLRSRRTLNRWEQGLPDDGDFQQHSTELEVPGLGVGKYYLLISDNALFTPRKGIVKWALVDIASFTVLKKQEGDSLAFYTLDRETGFPIPGIELRITGENAPKHPFTTDTNGKIQLSTARPIDSTDYVREYEGRYFMALPRTLEENWSFQFSRGGEQLELSANTPTFQKEEKLKRSLTTVFFTDRLIYKPGEIIQFKGLVMYKKGRDHQIVADTSLSVRLLNPQDSAIATVQVQTNRYGTFSGHFWVPDPTEAGDYTLLTQGGGIVLEIKPYRFRSFEVKLAISQKSFSIGDSIRLAGKALNVRGKPVAGAHTRYQVIRQVSFPYWKQYFWWKQTPGVDARIVARGTLKTDADGKFSIDFKAKPSPVIKRSMLPVYEYVVLVTVKNAKGEEQLGTNGIKVGARDLWMDMRAPSEANTTSSLNVLLKGQHLNGALVPIDGRFRIIELSPPTQAYRHRRWKQVDQHLVDLETYKGKFPFDPYGYELDPRSWGARDTLWEVPLGFLGKSTVSLPKLPQGNYKLQFETQDSFGKPLKIHRYLVVHDPQSKLGPYPSILQVYVPSGPFYEGDSVEVSLGTAVDSLWVVCEKAVRGKYVGRKEFLLRAKKQKINIPIRKEEQGNVQLFFTALKHNDFQQIVKTLQVPYRAKQLTLALSPTNVGPGEELAWRIQVKDASGRPVQAELMVAVFDEGIDLFQSHEFELPLYEPYFASLEWESHGFGIRKFFLASQHWNPYQRTASQGYFRFAGYGFEGLEDIQLKAIHRRQRISRLEPLLRIGDQAFARQGNRRDVFKKIPF